MKILKEILKGFGTFFLMWLATTALIGGVTVFVQSETYTVYKTTPEGRVVLILDPDGNRVSLKSLDGISYDEVWVAPDFDPNLDR